jgi:membrane protease YdiL (CAAX protease family)
MPETLRNDPSASLLLGLIVGFLLLVGIAVWLYRRSGGRLLLREESRPLVPWGPLSVLGVLLLYLGLSGICLLRPPGVVPSLREQLSRMAVLNVALVYLIPLLLRATSGAKLADLGLSSNDLGRLCLLGATGCALAVPVVYSVQLLAVSIWTPTDHMVQKALTADHSWLTALVAAFGAIVGAPVVEELLFRGVLLATLWKIAAQETGTRKPLTEFLANIAVSLLFGWLHLAQWPAPIPLFVLSMMLGELYRRSGSLVATIVMHACFNGLSMAALLLAMALGRLPH